jgi:hypothetical protein
MLYGEYVLTAPPPPGTRPQPLHCAKTAIGVTEMLMGGPTMIGKS